MITTEYFENDTYKEIYYRDERGVAFRHLLMEFDGKIIHDSLSEFDDNGKILTTVIFAPDHLTKYAYREYHYDAEREEKGFTDYFVENGVEKLVAQVKHIWLEKNKILRSNYYNANDELVYYTLYEDDEACGMVSEGDYDTNNQRLDLNEFDDVKANLPFFFQYYLYRELPMQNTEILNFIQSRRSMGNLIAPAPNHEQIEHAIATAITAPDHKNLEPWRFIVFSGDSLQELGQALHQSALENGETDVKSLEKALKMPNRAPMIIACVTDYKVHEKVPKSEQLLSCGASVQNLLLALQALGFATVWRSGELSHTKSIKQFLNISDENEVVGFIYVGTAGTPLPPRKAMDVQQFIQYR